MRAQLLIIQMMLAFVMYRLATVELMRDRGLKEWVASIIGAITTLVIILVLVITARILA